MSCLECGRCCTYVAVGINAPRSVRYATDVLWYLYHERCSVFLDTDDDWFVAFETRCRNLGPDLKCAVYATRPEICRGFDEQTCEVNAPDTRSREFKTPDEFLEYVRGWKPALHRRLLRDFTPPR